MARGNLFCPEILLHSIKPIYLHYETRGEQPSLTASQRQKAAAEENGYFESTTEERKSAAQKLFERLIEVFNK